MMEHMPKVRHRDMEKGLTKVAGTHQAIVQGIQDRAAAEEAAQKKRDMQLNASSRLTGKTK